MESVDEDTYLGDIISGDGKNTKIYRTALLKDKEKYLQL